MSSRRALSKIRTRETVTPPTTTREALPRLVSESRLPFVYLTTNVLLHREGHQDVPHAPVAVSDGVGGSDWWADIPRRHVERLFSSKCARRYLDCIGSRSLPGPVLLSASTALFPPRLEFGDVLDLLRVQPISTPGTALHRLAMVTEFGVVGAHLVLRHSIIRESALIAFGSESANA